MSEPQQPNAPLARVRAAAKDLARLEDAQRVAASELAGAMYDAHALGHTWSEIASSAGLASSQTARTRARQALRPEQLSPSERWRQERGRSPRPTAPTPGISITEAAARLGVTRKTVYAWIAKGKLDSVKDEAGRPRVLLDG